MTFAQQVAALSPSLWWRLDETSGTTAADNTGNGHTGAYASTSVQGGPGLAGDGDAGAQFGVVSPGADAIQETDSFSSGAGWSVGFFVQARNTQAQPILDCGDTAHLTFGIDTNGYWLLANYAGARFAGGYQGSVPKADTNAHFIVFTHGTDGYARAYFDGQPIGYESIGWGLANAKIHAGTTNAAYTWFANSLKCYANVDEVMVWQSTCLTAQQVFDLYAAAGYAAGSASFGSAAIISKGVAAPFGAAARIIDAITKTIGAGASISAKALRSFTAAAEIVSSNLLAPFGAGATISQNVTMKFEAGAYVVPETLTTVIGAGAFIVPDTVRAVISAAASIGALGKALIVAAARIAFPGFAQNASFEDHVDEVCPAQRITSALTPYTPPRNLG